MDHNQPLPDGGMLYGLGLDAYIQAIQNAPEGTLIRVGDLEPEKWMRCDKCGDEMSAELTGYHSC